MLLCMKRVLTGLFTHRLQLAVLCPVAVLLAGCSSGSGQALADRLAQAPRPQGAAVTSEQHDNNFEQGARARLEMTVPTRPSVACRDVVGGYLTAGYYLTGATAYDAGGKRLSVGPITDAEAWCAIEDRKVMPSGYLRNSDVRAYPPGGPRKNLSDGFVALIRPADYDNPDRSETFLWLSAP